MQLARNIEFLNVQGGFTYQISVLTREHAVLLHEKDLKLQILFCFAGQIYFNATVILSMGLEGKRLPFLETRTTSKFQVARRLWFEPAEETSPYIHIKH